jgi:amino acid adenylation domain-containing protein
MCVHDLIETRAKATPDAVAVVAGAKRLTYRELDDRANELAVLLRSLGVRAETRVGLCMRRSAALAVGALGIWKAGGAFVALDPNDPPNRLAMLLEDSDSHLVVANADSAHLLATEKRRAIVLDEDGVLPSRVPTELTPTQVQPDHLAYVIFTSGSTGRPKGVQITHANLLNLIGWHIGAFGVTSSDRATMQASPGFDAAIWELWPYLCTGATVHVIDDAVRTTPELLRDWMVATGITVSFLPTALAESMIALPWPPDTRLRFLLTGADVLRRYPPQGLPFTLVNNYGPTECTVVATSGVISPNAKGDTLPTIGRPIENVQVYIVDEHLNQVPQGVSGELLIGGAGVGRGYLNLPELSAGRFLANPFAPGKGCVYRTGDRARMLPDGQIAFLGRVDEQMKMRGYRIEPGEISAVLDRHPLIESSVVTTHASESGEARLVAYIVTKPTVRVQASELRAFVADQLPDYMVPSAFVRIGRLPITSHGKVDRNSLPDPTPENVLADDVFEPPQSEIEHWLADFLTTLLGVPRVSRDDNFFRLGGHSLMGAQLIAKIQQNFGVELSLRGLFDHPTVAGIASEIDGLIHAQLSAMSDDEVQHVLQSLSSPGSV